MEKEKHHVVVFWRMANGEDGHLKFDVDEDSSSDDVFDMAKAKLATRGHDVRMIDSLSLVTRYIKRVAF